MRDPNHGFTLIELLIVIAIIGLLVAVLIPSLVGARTRAHDTAAAGCAKQIAASQEVVFIDTQAYALGLVAVNAATQNMANNCEAAWADDTTAFTIGWEVSHPNGSGLIYTVGPGGIIPPPYDTHNSARNKPRLQQAGHLSVLPPLTPFVRSGPAFNWRG